MQYKVSMVRDMIGWKVSNVELYFPARTSAGGASLGRDVRRVCLPASFRLTGVRAAVPVRKTRYAAAFRLVNARIYDLR